MSERNDLAADEMTEEVETLTPTFTNYFGATEDILDKYCHCALCGSNLHFTHVTDFHQNLTREIARCPECGVKASQSLFSLQ